MKKMDNRMKGETWYYTPCGRRMKQFPEIIKVAFAVFITLVLVLLLIFPKGDFYFSYFIEKKSYFRLSQYLKKYSDGVVSREHFSFSPRMPVGDFYEERETSEVCLVFWGYKNIKILGEDSNLLNFFLFSDILLDFM